MAILEALNFNVWTFLFQIINLLIVIAILNKLLYQPVIKIMREREESIERSIADAKAAKVDSEKLLVEYQGKMDNAKQEAQEIINRASKTGEDMKQQIVSEAQEEAARTVAKAKEEIIGEKTKALAEIRNEVANLALLAAGKVVNRTINDEDQKKFVEEFVSEVGELQ